MNQLLEDRDHLGRLRRCLVYLGELMDYLKLPRTMEEIVALRFVFRPGSEGLMVDQVEGRSMAMHLDRLQRAGRVVKHKQTFIGA